MNLLTNKYVLYFIAFLSIVNILSYFFEGQFGAIGFFTLVAFLMFYFTSNLIIVLGISLFATNLLGALSELFIPVNLFNFNKKKENFENSSHNPTNEINTEYNKIVNTATNLGKNIHPKPSIPPSLSEEESSLKEENNKIKSNESMTNFDSISGNNMNDKSNQMALFSDEKISAIDQTTEMSGGADMYKKNQDLNDFLNSNITSQNLEKIQEKTSSLLKDQNKMMAQISDLGPILNSSLQAIGNISTGNVGGTISTLTNNLDSLFEKYPDAFPANYQEKKKDIENKMKDIQTLNSKMDEYSKDNPGKLEELKKKINLPI